MLDIHIGSTVRYWMDLRGVTVGDIKVALKDFLKQMGDWKSRGDWQFKQNAEFLDRGEPVEWLDKRIGDLVVIFTGEGQGQVKIITTYWRGLSDPKGPAEQCPLRRASQGVPAPGYQTFVHERHPTKSETGDDGGGYKERALPSPPWKRKFPSHKSPAINGPGPSGTGEEERSVHEDMARTQGEAGKEHPVEESRTTPVRRPGLTASDEDILALLEREAGMKGPPYPPMNMRQHVQRGTAVMYDRRRYRKDRGSKARKMQMRHKRLRANPRYQLDRERRREHPERFERKPAGGVTSLADRSQRKRDDAKRNPMIERQKAKYRAKKAAALQEPVLFIWMPTGMSGQVQDVSPTTGLVEVELGNEERSIPLDEFLDKSYIEEVAFDQFVQYLDELFEYESDDDEAPEGEDASDPIFEQWVQTRLAFQVHQRPTQRQHKQRGQAKLQTHRNYVKNRSRYRMQSRKRYQKMKRNPQFKRQQQIRRQHPERFKRRLAQVAIPPDIALVLGDDLRPAVVHSVSPLSEMVTVVLLGGQAGLGTDLVSYSLDEFFDQATFLTPEDEQRMFYLLDGAHGLFDEEDAEIPLSDPENEIEEFEARTAEMFYEKRPPAEEPGSSYDQALSWNQDERERYERRPGGLLEQPEVRDNPGSGKVIPEGHDFQNRADRAIKTALRISEIQQACRPDLRQKAERLSVTLRRVDQKNRVWLFDVQGSKGDDYRVKLKAEAKPQVRGLDKADVFVSCSCPFWQWQGPEHWAKQHKYLFGRPVGTASRPAAKDPDHQHGACKHVLACFDWIIKNNWKMPIPSRKMSSEDRVARRFLQKQAGWHV
ncbi:MAG: hypothetical protein A2Y38_10375 [Spirochaetes bacterium GWB1_59_5]|nr:MAG: hypothetical protein A2Y38_10375 [Spirochaetes bacterium GWB1_59_5]